MLTLELKCGDSKNEHPALTGEVSIKEKMLSQTSPRLRRTDVGLSRFNNIFIHSSWKLNLRGTASLGFKTEVPLG